MSSLHSDWNSGRTRIGRRRRHMRYLVEKARVAPGRLLTRLLLASLAGTLAVMFWRERDH